MDFSEATEKITNTVKTVTDTIEIVQEKVDTSREEINTLIEQLETTINTAIADINSGAVSGSSNGASKWVDMKIEKITKDIQDKLDGLKTNVDDKLNSIEEWYEKTITNIKTNVIKSKLAMLGMEVSNEEIEVFAKAIPHPDVKAFMPKINLEIELPELNGLVEIDAVKIPRI